MSPFLSLSLSRSRASVHSRIVDVAKRRSIMTIGRAGQVFREAAIRGHRLTRRILGICVEHNSFALRKLARAESSLAKSHALSIADRMHGVTKGQGYAVARSPGSPSKHLSRIVISRLRNATSDGHARRGKSEAKFNAEFIARDLSGASCGNFRSKRSNMANEDAVARCETRSILLSVKITA